MSGDERLALLGLTMLPPVGVYHPLRLETTDGLLEARYYLPSRPRGGILWLPAAPRVDARAEALFERLAERFLAFGVASLWMRYRRPIDVTSCVLDALVGAHVLREQGLAPLAAVGHGSGAFGAVQTKRQSPDLSGVALLEPDAAAEKAASDLLERPMVIRADGDLLEAADAVAEELSEWLIQALHLNVLPSPPEGGRGMFEPRPGAKTG
ncbi:MAG TPA: hypothetical protein V6D47_08940 [Oscillatoriaceae cyanobacterium]